MKIVENFYFKWKMKKWINKKTFIVENDKKRPMTIAFFIYRVPLNVLRRIKMFDE